MFRYNTTERFGNAPAGVVLLSNRIGKAIDTEFAARPRCHEADRFTAKAFAVAIFSNPDAQLCARSRDVVKPRQSKEFSTFAPTDY